MCLIFKFIERLIIKNFTSDQIAALLVRAEVFSASPEELRYYRKGAKSMLQVFISDDDFVLDVINDFDYIVINSSH